MALPEIGQLALEYAKLYATYEMTTKDLPDRDDLRKEKRAELFKGLFDGIQKDKYMRVNPLERFIPKDMHT